MFDSPQCNARNLTELERDVSVNGSINEMAKAARRRLEQNRKVLSHNRRCNSSAAILTATGIASEQLVGNSFAAGPQPAWSFDLHDTHDLYHAGGLMYCRKC